MDKRLFPKTTQHEVAARVGCAERYINLVNLGLARPSPDLAEKLEKLTGVSRLIWLYRGGFTRNQDILAYAASLDFTLPRNGGNNVSRHNKEAAA